MMQWFLCLLLLSCSVISPVLASVTLKVGPTAGAGTPVEVEWTREEGDPGHFDLRFLLDGEDVGVVAASVKVDEHILSGKAKVTFPQKGSFVLAAIGPELVNLGESHQIEVRSSSDPPSSSAPSIPHGSAVPTGTITVPTPYVAPMQIGTKQSRLTSSSRTADGPPTNPSPSWGSPALPAAIIGAVFGGVLVLALVIFLFLRTRRSRQSKDQRRVTFHRDLMVQQQHRPDPVDVPVDVEEGHYTSSISPIAFQCHSAALPFPASSTGSRPYTPVHEGPTERQILLNKRVRQLEEMMHEIRFRPGMSRVLEQLRVQMSWLRAQRNSPWALGETDEPPQHYDLYLGGR